MKEKEIIVEILESIGIYIDTICNDNISDIIDDSLTFISFIIEVEERFKISIPDIYLNIDMIGTIDDFIDVIKEISKDNSNNEIIALN